MDKAINENSVLYECNIPDEDFSISSNLKSRTDFFLQTVNEYFDKIGTTNIDMGLVSQAIERYRLYSDYLCVNVAKIETPIEQKDTDIITELSIISMILTGSLLEATLVFFLLVYSDEYLKDSKYHWVLEDGSNVDISALKESLFKHLESLVNDGKITSRQRNSLKATISYKLKPHEIWKEITKLTLENLIDFCKDNLLFDTKNGRRSDQEQENDKALEDLPQHIIAVTSNPSNSFFKLLCESLDSHNYQLFDKTDKMSQDDIIDAMKEIQNSRNNVHVFTQNPTTDSCKTLRCISLLCRIINDLCGRIFMKTNVEISNNGQ